MIHRKWSAVLTALLLAAAFSACAGKSKDISAEPTELPGMTEAAAPAETLPETEPETEAPTAPAVTAETIRAALTGTVWSGVNGDAGAFAVGFSEKEITYVTQDGDTTEGFWKADPETDKLYIYSDEAMTSELRSIPFHYNAEKNVVQLEEKVYMVNTGAENREAAAEEAGKLSHASVTYSQKLLNAYWGGGDESYALIFMLRGDGTCDMHYYDAMDGVINETTFFWGMSSDTICFYNEDYNPVMYFTWSAEGDTFTLSDQTTGNVVNCTELTPEEAQDVSYQLGVLAGAYEPGAYEDAEGGYEVIAAE